MSTEPGGVKSDSDYVFEANASRFVNEIARKSETLADSEGCVSVSDDESEKRNGFCDLKKKTESVVVVETKGGEIENDSAVIQIVCSNGVDSENVGENRDLDDSDLVYKEKVCSHGDDICNGVDSDAESEDRDKEESKLESLMLSDSDLVWAKVRSYPWWPGQVFDSSAATRKAKKYYKKGNSLVMYFGDCTFAWNDSFCIKPFHQFFSQMAKQSKTIEFRNAVDCALEEVSRRVEFGLSCSCISEEAYNKVKAQKIVNPGIREGYCVRYGGDELSSAVFFKPTEVLEYMKCLACSPSYDASDKLRFVTNRARLLAFQEWQSYLYFPKYETFIKSLEFTAPEASVLEPNTDEEMSSERRTTDCKDDAAHKGWFGFEDKKTDEKKKKKTLSDFIAEKRFEKLNSEKKRKGESLESDKKIKNKKYNEEFAPEKLSSSPDVEIFSNLHAEKTGKETITESSISNDPWNYENFLKELSCINKLKDDSKKTSIIITETSSESWNVKDSSETDEMLSSLHNVKTRMEIIPESISNNPSNYEDFEKFVKELPSSNLNDDSKMSITEISESMDVQTGLKDSTGSDSKEQTDLKDITGSGSKDSTSDSIAATALFLNFADSGSVPSIEKLNKVFNRYGSLIESETKVLKKNGKRAKVVFENSEDAKTAFSSAGKYSIFGPSLLSYKLKHVCIKTKRRNKNITKNRETLAF